MACEPENATKVNETSEFIGQNQSIELAVQKDVQNQGNAPVQIDVENPGNECVQTEDHTKGDETSQPSKISICSVRMYSLYLIFCIRAGFQR